MSRERICRAKRKDTNTWLRGYYYQSGDYNLTGKEKHYIILPYGSKINAIEIIPETVGEYLNKSDKIWKDIYEGDILKHDDGTNNVEIGVVVYNSELAMFQIEFTEGQIKRRCDFYQVKSDNCEVIGNIHDNPELLEVGK